MGVKETLETVIRHQMEFLVGNSRASYMTGNMLEVLERKRELLAEREAELLKCDARVSIIRELTVGKHREIDYLVHVQYLIRQKDFVYAEEEQTVRRAIFEGGRLQVDTYVEPEPLALPDAEDERDGAKKSGLIPYQYNRLEAVKYAEAWWNGRNPAYQNFQDNCTNFISQCVRAGQSPMTGHPNRGRGWWQQGGSWSWSWSVAHSFQLFLTGGASIGLRAQLVASPQELLLGDVIAYDFENDGRWNHTTIVTAKDANGFPLVNAHSADSRKRHWAYLDSSKYTPQMKYKFFHILDNE